MSEPSDWLDELALCYARAAAHTYLRELQLESETHETEGAQKTDDTVAGTAGEHAESNIASAAAPKLSHLQDCASGNGARLASLLPQVLQLASHRQAARRADATATAGAAMSAAPLLERLQRVQQCGDRFWHAGCPLHATSDDAACLDIREDQNGWVTIQCAAGCGAADVIAATGLEFGALYPEVLTVQP